MSGNAAMCETEPIDERRLRRMLFQCSRNRISTDPPILMAVPVAFPIIEVSYLVKERIPQNLGLIRRYVLEGLCRFGPCRSEDLTALLGIDSDVILDILTELSQYVPGVSQDGPDFSASPEAREVLKKGNYTCIAEHPRKFLVNGLTDKILDKNFWRYHRAWRLQFDPDMDKHCLDEAGRSTAISVKIIDDGSTGYDHLQLLTKSINTAARKKAGIPEGGCGCNDELESRFCSSVAAFLLIDVRETCSIVTLAKDPVSLLEDRLTRKEYLNEVCRGIQDLGDNMPNTYAKACKDLDSTFQGRASVIPTEFLGTVRIELHDTINTEFARLTRALIEGLYWDHHHFLFRLVPADAATAARMASLRAVRDLRRVFRQEESGQVVGSRCQLDDWWAEWQLRFINDLPETAAFDRLPLDVLLREADILDDTEFHERIDSVARG